MRPAEAVHEPPHRRLAQRLRLVGGAPGAELERRSIWRRFQLRVQEDHSGSRLIAEGSPESTCGIDVYRSEPVSHCCTAPV